MKNLRRCQFCGFHYEPPNFHRIPSLTCDRCYLEISEELGHEPDFLPINAGRGKKGAVRGAFSLEDARRITWRPPNPEVAQ
jgi:hypothetical protein